MRQREQRQKRLGATPRLPSRRPTAPVAGRVVAGPRRRGNPLLSAASSVLARLRTGANRRYCNQGNIRQVPSQRLTSPDRAGSPYVRCGSWRDRLIRWAGHLRTASCGSHPTTSGPRWATTRITTPPRPTSLKRSTSSPRASRWVRTIRGDIQTTKDRYTARVAGARGPSPGGAVKLLAAGRRVNRRSPARDWASCAV
jgi:hypothetical protein